MKKEKSNTFLFLFFGVITLILIWAQSVPSRNLEEFKKRTEAIEEENRRFADKFMEEQEERRRMRYLYSY